MENIASYLKEESIKDKILIIKTSICGP